MMLIELFKLFNKLEDWLNALELLKKIGAIEQDILGAYFFRIPEVRLYWMVIGLIAGALQVSVEALTFVVAAHELGHAYTHLGRDIDGRRWDVDVFSRTDRELWRDSPSSTPGWSARRSKTASHPHWMLTRVWSPFRLVHTKRISTGAVQKKVQVRWCALR